MTTSIVWFALLVFFLATGFLASWLLKQDDMPVGRHARTAQLRPHVSGYRYDRAETVTFSRVAR